MGWVGKVEEDAARWARHWLVRQGEKLLGDPGEQPAAVTAATPPHGFPSGIAVDAITFEDWSGYITVPETLIARVTDADQVAAICTWAVDAGYTVRPMGIGHNWSPIIMTRGTSPAPMTMLVDTTHLTSASFAMNGDVPQATFGTGVTMDAATAFLQDQDNGNPGSAPGYALPSVPAPGHLTLGGVLAIGGHGTVVPSEANESAQLMGGLSNLIVSFEAIVSDPDGDGSTYVRRTFDRSDADAGAFLVHLGRAFLTSVTLRVVPNFYLQMTPQFPTLDELFAADATSSDLTFANLLDECGRVEILWFPYQSNAFVQCNKVQTEKIEPQVSGPYNFPWTNITEWESSLIAAALIHEPQLTPYFSDVEYGFFHLALEGETLNGTSRDLEIYLKDTTLKVQLSGWVLQTNRADVQSISNQFYVKVAAMLDEYRSRNLYPVNAAIEVRCTTMDVTEGLGSANAAPPTLAATHSIDPGNSTLDTVVWLNVGSIPGTPGMGEFYSELEDWLVATWGSSSPNPLRVEWSKAFAWTTDGPWTSTERLEWLRAAYDQADDGAATFSAAAATLARYDHGSLFTNPFLGQLFET